MKSLFLCSAVFLRPCGAYGVVVPLDPGLIALGYFPMPLRGAKVNDAASPAQNESVDQPWDKRPSTESGAPQGRGIVAYYLVAQVRIVIPKAFGANVALGPLEGVGVLVVCLYEAVNGLAYLQGFVKLAPRSARRLRMENQIST